MFHHVWYFIPVLTLLRYIRRNSGRRSVELTVPLSQCGTQTVESNTDRLMIENTIIIQHDPMVQDSWDAARKITCDWQSKLEKMVTFAPFPVADLQGVAEIKFAGSGDNVKTRMEIQVGRGPFAPTLEGLTKIGDELSVVVYVQDGGAGYDILVKNCYAYDSKNFKNANKIRLLNEHGCLFRPHQMEYFRRTFDVRSTGADIIAFARMNAFKFPDKMDVFLSCELEMCKGGCDTHCEMDDYPIDIIETLRNEPRSSRRNEAEAVPVTTFRPAERNLARDRGMVMKRRRRLPKKFGSTKVEDDAAKLLSPPATLSPEILELLEELGNEQNEITERSEKGNVQFIDSLGSGSTSTTKKVTASLRAVDNDLSHEGTTEKIKKMSFSTLFSSNGGTHVTTNDIPAQILNNPSKFEPSELLSASIEQNAGPFTDQITSLSKGSTGSQALGQGSLKFPPRVRNIPRAAALQQDPDSISAKLMDIMVHDITNPKFTSSDQSFLTNSFSSANARSGAEQTVNTVNTLQQHLVSEGQAGCGPGSADPKCGRAQFQFSGGFMPMSTTPNILTSTIMFTSPRSVEKLQRHFENTNNSPKDILLKILDPKGISPALDFSNFSPPQLPEPRRNGRKKFGSRLQVNTDRFAHFFGARKRRGAGAEPDQGEGDIRNVFAESETVNMIKGFQVLSASDLAFNPSTLTQLMEEAQGGEGLTGSQQEPEICFHETSFYAGLLIVCSLLIISGMVSVCSIRKIRKYQHSNGIKKMFFGDTCSTLERY